MLLLPRAGLLAFICMLVPPVAHPSPRTLPPPAAACLPQPVLTTPMKSVGEAMALGRTFQESFQKAMRSLETGLDGWSLPKNHKRLPADKLVYNMRVPNPERMVAIKQALEDGTTIEEVHEYTNIDPWFLAQVRACGVCECARCGVREAGQGGGWAFPGGTAVGSRVAAAGRGDVPWQLPAPN